MRIRGGVRAAVLACALAVPSLSARALDSAVATALLESGKKALAAKKCDEAVSMFRKALSEDPALIEAAYWLAAAEEKSGDETAALADYRQFLALLGKKGGSATPEEQKLRPLSEKRVDALAVWEKEYLKIEEKYVGELLAFAKDRSEKEPWVAARALDLVLEVQPKHPAVRSLKEKISGKGGGKEGEELFPEVVEWRDLIAAKVFKPAADKGSYDGHVLTLRMKGSVTTYPGTTVTMGPSFAYEMEVRVIEVLEEPWEVGLAFGATTESVCDVTLRNACVFLRAGERRARTLDLESKPVAPRELGTWRRLSVGVRGNTVQVWLDGKKLIEDRVKDRADLAGDLGIIICGCRLELRMLRTGSL